MANVNKMAWACEHVDRLHLAKGLCQPCYDKKRWKENPKYKEQSAERQRKYRAKNKEALAAKSTVWKEANKDRCKRVRRAYALKTEYGITLEQYEAMLESQGYVCAICSEPPDSNSKKPFLAVDHRHASGNIRALLCLRCNLGLGYFRERIDILQSAIDYIFKWEEPETMAASQ